MNKRKNHKPRRLSPFERETERRRKEMVRNLSGTSHTSNINHRRLVVLRKEGIRPVIVQDDDGKDVPLYRGPRPNLWRQMLRDERRAHRAVAA